MQNYELLDNANLSEMEKAQILIADDNISLVNISRKLNIPLSTLKGYRGNEAKLKAASWVRINGLANYADEILVQRYLGTEDGILFVRRLTNWFSHEKENYPEGKGMQSMIDKMEQIIIRNPVAVLKLKNAFNKTE